MKDKFQQLKQFSTASFAVWPFNEHDTDKFHSNLIILGLNPSKDIEFGTNFHGNRFDVWYQEAFSKPPFLGAYMTDLISIGEPSAKLVVEKWKDKSFRAEHIKNLKQQFNSLEINEMTPIFCIGKNTESLFRLAFPEYINVYSIGHPNSYRMKNNKQVFLDDVVVVGSLIQKETAG
jgi:hypothetical protein